MGQFDVNGFYSESESQRPDRDEKYASLGCMGLTIAFVLICMAVMVAFSWTAAP